MIHQYKLFGYNIVLDIASGSVHVVDEVAYDIIGMFREKTKEEIIAFILDKYKDNPEVTEEETAECYGEIDKLRRMKRLFVEDTFEAAAGKLKEKTRGVVKALCLHIALHPLHQALSPWHCR